MREFYLSSSMLESETGIAYEVTDGYASRFSSKDPTRTQYVVSITHSQGFDWNQDLFATRYEQMCQVIYDGHVDTMQSLIENLAEKAESDEEESSHTESSEYQHSPGSRRMSSVLLKPRRKSDRSISFSADREQGTFRKTEVTVIDVESDTQENRTLRS